MKTLINLKERVWVDVDIDDVPEMEWDIESKEPCFEDSHGIYFEKDGSQEYLVYFMRDRWVEVGA